jgi:hypothetical protein
VVTSITAITPIIVGDNHTCFNETAQLSTATEYVSYEWSNNTFGSLALVTPGVYTVTVEDENGCIGTSQPFTVGNSTPTPFIDGFERFCKFDTIELFVNDTFETYRWVYLNDTLSTADTLTWLGGTPDNDDVVVIVTDEFGCVGVDTLNAPYTELPVAGYSYEPNTAAVLINTPINFTNTSTPGAGDTVATWFWVFNNPPADEDTVYIRVFEDDTERIFNTLCISCTSHIEEVGWFSTRKLNNVHCSHCQTGAVYHTTHITIQFYEIETEFLSFNLGWVFFVLIIPLSQIWMTIKCVII